MEVKDGQKMDRLKDKKQTKRRRKRKGGEKEERKYVTNMQKVKFSERQKGCEEAFR